MATSEGGRRSPADQQSGRESGRGGARRGTRDVGSRDEELDLLTAALLGGVIGAAAGFLLRPRPRPRGVLGRIDIASERAAKRARKVRKQMGRHASDSASWVRGRGDALAEHLSPDAVSGQVSK